jgi:hypothetical protein
MAAGSGGMNGATDPGGSTPRTTALAPVLPGAMVMPMPSPELLPPPLMPSPRLASPRLDDVSPDPIPDRQLDYFLRLASARRSRADTIGLADSSPDARLSDESLAMLYEEEDGEPVEHLLGAVPEPTLPVDTSPVTALDPNGPLMDSLPDLPLRAPPTTPLPIAVGLAPGQTTLRQPRAPSTRPVLRDVGADTGESTALASPALTSATFGAGPLPLPPRPTPPPRALTTSGTPESFPIQLARRRRRQRLIWAAAAGAFVVVALVAYGLFGG